MKTGFVFLVDYLVGWRGCPKRETLRNGSGFLAGVWLLFDISIVCLIVNAKGF